jgi:acyl-CoA reductase-like NAD-dependent aldehyde dehydrogenase
VRAVQAARQAFPSWSPTPLSDRLAVIERVGFVLSERLEQIGLLISQEVGMPVRQAIAIQAALPAMTFNSVAAGLLRAAHRLLGGHARDVHRA